MSTIADLTTSLDKLEQRVKTATTEWPAGSDASDAAAIDAAVKRINDLESQLASIESQPASTGASVSVNPAPATSPPLVAPPAAPASWTPPPGP